MEANMDFSELSPCRFQCFTFPNPNPPNHYSDPLRIAVLDSPVSPPQLQPPQSQTAVMLVPPGREHDWIFSTEAGHLQLLLSSSSPPFYRLVLVGSLPCSFPKTYTRLSPLPDKDPDPIQDSLVPLLLALSPKSAFDHGYIPQVPFLSFEDDALHMLPVEVLEGPSVGEMIIEDVVIQQYNSCEIRRRLRFKRMPYLIQTQVRLIPDLVVSSCSTSDLLAVLKSRSFQVELGSLVQPYLAPMVAGLSLITNVVDEKVVCEIMPSCLCVGVGGGALLMCLRTRLGFDVHGLETDSFVLEVAKKHFGLVGDEFLHINIGDGIKTIKRYAREKGSSNTSLEEPPSSYDAIMVDLDSGDVISGVSAPPLEFIEKDILLAVKSILCKNGVLVMNVIPPLDSGSFYRHLVGVLSDVFVELYKIDVEDNENFVIVATRSEVQTLPRESGKQFLRKLEEIIGQQLISSISKISSNGA